MSFRRVRVYGEEVLRQKAQEVASISPEIIDLITDMNDTMRRSSGIGLAAPQIGVSLRVILFTQGFESKNPEVRALINPEIVSHGDSTKVMDEGCLSIPDVNGKVSRWEHITVSAMDPEGNKLDFSVAGISARIIQHEIDHLDGILFIDRLSPLKRDIIKRRLKKRLKKESNHE